MTSIPQALYRAYTFSPETPVKPKNTWRMPSNVPFYADNLWEWARPQGYPSRRSAAFASPSIGEARDSQPPSGDIGVYRVVLPARWKVAQLRGHQDANLHPDVRKLLAILKKSLGDEWFSGELTDKGTDAHLFCPGLHAKEVEAIVAKSVRLSAVELREHINFWKDVNLIEYNVELIDDSGEVFFEVPPEGYQLERVEEV